MFSWMAPLDCVRAHGFIYLFISRKINLPVNLARVAVSSRSHVLRSIGIWFQALDGNFNFVSPCGRSWTIGLLEKLKALLVVLCWCQIKLTMQLSKTTLLLSRVSQPIHAADVPFNPMRNLHISLQV